jgi:preprotein translocase subunit YajC
MQNQMLAVLLADQEGGNPMMMILMFGMIIAVMYFFMIRPQQKKQKEERKFRNEIQKGMKIVTIGGIHGKIEEVKDTSVIITTEGGGKLRVEKAAISMQFSAQTLAESK